MNSRSLEKLANQLGGKYFLIETYDSLFQITESFVMNYKYKVGFKLHSLPTSSLLPAKYFIDSNLAIDSTINEFFVQAVLKFHSGNLSNIYEVENISNNKAQCPFPEEPLPLDAPYLGFPSYYIDFNKIFVARIPSDMICERFEIDSQEIGRLIKNKLGETNELRKIYFPVFYRNQEEYCLFGLVKFTQKGNEGKFHLDFFCFPLHFVDFFEIWEEILKFENITSNIIQRLHLYFQKVPIYYSSYFFQLFQYKNWNELCMKKWKFLSSNIDLTLHISGIKKNIFEKLKLKKKVKYSFFFKSIYLSLLKNDEKAHISKQIHLKSRPECCSSTRRLSIFSQSTSDQKKAKMIGELLQSKANILPFKMIENIKDSLFLNYLNQNKFPRKEKMEIEQEKASLLNIEARSPYLEENEIKYIKEPVPYGNPFKLIMRNKSQKIAVDGEITDEAYLANLSQEKNIKKSPNVKPNNILSKKMKESGITSIF